MIFFITLLTRGDAASGENSNLQSHTQQYTVSEQVTCNKTQVQVPKHTKPNLPKLIVRFYPTLKNSPGLTKPKLLFLSKLYQT